MNYPIGSQLKIKASFPGASTGTNVFFKVKDPSAAVTIYQHGNSTLVSQISPGVYQFDLSLSTAGTWRVRAYCTGAVVGSSAVKEYVVDGDV